MNSEFAFDVFLCHSSMDKEMIRLLAERLKSDGLKLDGFALLDARVVGRRRNPPIPGLINHPLVRLMNGVDHEETGI